MITVWHRENKYKFVDYECKPNRIHWISTKDYSPMYLMSTYPLNTRTSFINERQNTAFFFFAQFPVDVQRIIV